MPHVSKKAKNETCSITLQNGVIDRAHISHPNKVCDLNKHTNLQNLRAVR